MATTSADNIYVWHFVAVALTVALLIISTFTQEWRIALAAAIVFGINALLYFKGGKRLTRYPVFLILLAVSAAAVMAYRVYILY